LSSIQVVESRAQIREDAQELNQANDLEHSPHRFGHAKQA
jgi:hypothetical protein